MSRVIDGAVLTEWISGECKSPSCPKNESAFGMRIIKHIERMPTIEPEPKWKRLMMHLADLQLTYSPNWGANGCGDQKLYEFVTGLIDELQGWKEGE